MENIINLNELEQSNLDFQTFNLSKEFTVYKTSYQSNFEQKQLLKRIEENKNLLFHKTDKYDNSILFFLECEEFKSIDNFGIEFYKKLKNIEKEYYAKSSWIYTQIKEFNMNWMHTHDYLVSSNKTDLKTQITFVYYIQIPNKTINNEGDIIFKTEDNKLYKYTPKENDMLFFSGDLQHMAVPTPNGEVDRIVYASNITFDFDSKIEKTKRIRFKNIIYNNLFGHSRDVAIK